MNGCSRLHTLARFACQAQQELLASNNALVRGLKAHVAKDLRMTRVACCYLQGLMSSLGAA